MNPAEAIEWLQSHLVLGLLTLTRLGMVLMVLPAVGVGVPRQVRAMLAIIMTVLLVPSIDNTTPLPAIDNLVELAIAMIREGLIGMLIGCTVQMAVTGAQLAGELITSTGGMQLGDSIDPSTQSMMPALARLVGMMVTASMLMFGGHRWVLSILVASFESLPPGAATIDTGSVETVTACLGAAMSSGVRIAAPVIAALLLSNIVTGLISRTLPQINVLAIGLSINALTMLMVTMLTIGSAAWIFRDALEDNLQAVSDRLLLQENILTEGRKPSGATPNILAEGRKPSGATPNILAEGRKPSGATPIILAEGRKPSGAAPNILAEGRKPSGFWPAPGGLRRSAKIEGAAPGGLRRSAKMGTSPDV